MRARPPEETDTEKETTGQASMLVSGRDWALAQMNVHEAKGIADGNADHGHRIRRAQHGFPTRYIQPKDCAG
jgi:hypothetical protein